MWYTSPQAGTGTGLDSHYELRSLFQASEEVSNGFRAFFSIPNALCTDCGAPNHSKVSLMPSCSLSKEIFKRVSMVQCIFTFFTPFDEAPVATALLSWFLPASGLWKQWTWSSKLSLSAAMERRGFPGSHVLRRVQESSVVLVVLCSFANIARYCKDKGSI